MTGAIAMVPVPEPMERTEFIEIGEFTVKYAVRDRIDFSNEAIDELHRLYIQPHLVRVANKLQQNFEDTFEFSVLNIEEGSITIQGLLKLAVNVTGHGVVAGLIISQLVNAQNNVNIEARYEDTIQKIQLILKYESKYINLCLVPLRTESIPVYRPKTKTYRMIKFEFCPVDTDQMVKKVKDTVDKYHGIIDRP